MTDIESLLSSISPEEMERLKNIASSIISDSSQNKGVAEEKPNASSGALSGISLDAFKPIMSVIGKMNDNDDRIKLITHLKPLLSDERQRRADEAVKFLHIMQILPELRGLL